LQLSSKNAEGNNVRIVFCGIVDESVNARQGRHYAAMDIDGDDLVILSRSGDDNSASAHNGNIIAFHRACNFIDLIY